MNAHHGFRAGATVTPSAPSRPGWSVAMLEAAAAVAVFVLLGVFYLVVSNVVQQAEQTRERGRLEAVERARCGSMPDWRSRDLCLVVARAANGAVGQPSTELVEDRSLPR